MNRYTNAPVVILDSAINLLARIFYALGRVYTVLVLVLLSISTFLNIIDGGMSVTFGPFLIMNIFVFVAFGASAFRSKSMLALFAEALATVLLLLAVVVLLSMISAWMVVENVGVNEAIQLMEAGELLMRSPSELFENPDVAVLGLSDAIYDFVAAMLIVIPIYLLRCQAVISHKLKEKPR